MSFGWWTLTERGELGVARVLTWVGLLGRIVGWLIILAAVGTAIWSVVLAQAGGPLDWAGLLLALGGVGLVGGFVLMIASNGRKKAAKVRARVAQRHRDEGMPRTAARIENTRF